jgi:hypothetical protein
VSAGRVEEREARFDVPRRRGRHVERGLVPAGAEGLKHTAPPPHTPAGRRGILHADEKRHPAGLAVTHNRGGVVRFQGSLKQIEYLRG